MRKLGFFLRITFFYHLVLILHGKAVFLPFSFHMHTYPKAIGMCGVTSGAGGDGEGMPFSESFPAFPWGRCYSLQFIFPIQP